MRATRLGDGPIITPELGRRLGRNINGPSLVKPPDWLPHRLGNYYLYFASHTGDHIRLAFADTLSGPWLIHEPGVLDLEASLFCREPLVAAAITNPLWAKLMRDHGESILNALGPHIASPDVHLDPERREVQLYFHGLLENGDQMTRLATSNDGLRFRVRPELLGPSYFRVFRHESWWYAMAAAGRLHRSGRRLHPVRGGTRAGRPPGTSHGGAGGRRSAAHLLVALGETRPSGSCVLPSSWSVIGAVGEQPSDGGTASRAHVGGRRPAAFGLETRLYATACQPAARPGHLLRRRTDASALFGGRRKRHRDRRTRIRRLIGARNGEGGWSIIEPIARGLC